ncbi:MAG: MFS transporter [Candidatus Zipacnadales bacterium]
MNDSATKQRSVLQGLGRNVIVLGVVSLLTDISHEMLYPVVPLFLTTVLGAPMTAVGLIEGVAECTSNLMKVGAGWYSDHLRKRRPFLFGGYTLSAISKPLLALATTWHLVLASRLLDRLGKGIRTGARDSLLAASCDPAHRGKAFGIHRAMDTAGAFLGPLFALLLLSQFHVSYRTIFVIAFIPALAGVMVIFCVRREGLREDPFLDHRRTKQGVISSELRSFLAVAVLFAIGNSSDVFLLLRAKEVGFSQSFVLLVYMFYNLIHALAAGPVGGFSDQLGRRRVIIAGFCTFALVYLGFAFISAPALIWPLFALYGLYSAAAEGVTKAHVVDLSDPNYRGTALGLLQTVMGLAAFMASVVAGALWTHVASWAPFAYGATCALLAAALFAASTRWSRPSPLTAGPSIHPPSP